MQKANGAFDMAAANALSKRDSEASRLQEAIRQLRRYLDSESRSERILMLKSQKVENAPETLIEAHEIYLEKSGKSREDAEQTQCINEKSDSAEDIIDEASLAIEDINKETTRQVEATIDDTRADKIVLERKTLKLQSESKENVRNLV